MPSRVKKDPGRESFGPLRNTYIGDRTGYQWFGSVTRELFETRRGTWCSVESVLFALQIQCSRPKIPDC